MRAIYSRFYMVKMLSPWSTILHQSTKSITLIILPNLASNTLSQGTNQESDPDHLYWMLGLVAFSYCCLSIDPNGAVSP